jgi:hypothetical protein
MVLRRLAGVLTALFMLHLSLVASDAACAAHMGGRAQMPGHADHGQEQHQRPYETPVQPNCCQALASCGSAFAASASRTAPPAPSRVAIPRSVIDMPLSELVAPDTPPPKA